jgi:hypothetical protein
MLPHILHTHFESLLDTVPRARQFLPAGAALHASALRQSGCSTYVHGSHSRQYSNKQLWLGESYWSVCPPWGPLPLYYEDWHDAAEPTRAWFPKRPVSADLELNLHGLSRPRALEAEVGRGTDLPEDQGGLIGSFMAFIPLLTPVDLVLSLASA